MKVNVKLFGLALRVYPDADPKKGMEVEMPEGAILLDLIRHLKITNRSGVFLSVDGELGRWDTRLRDGAQVDIRIIMTGG